MQEPGIPPQLLRTRAAARYLGLSRKALLLLAYGGEIASIRGKGLHGPWRFDVRELDRWAGQQKRRAG